MVIVLVFVFVFNFLFSFENVFCSLHLQNTTWPCHLIQTVAFQIFLHFSCMKLFCHLVTHSSHLLVHFSVFHKLLRRWKWIWNWFYLRYRGHGCFWLFWYVTCSNIINAFHKILHHLPIHQVLTHRQERLWSVFNCWQIWPTFDGQFNHLSREGGTVTYDFALVQFT